MNKQITLNDISLKTKSKREVYLVLTVEGGLYLPPIMDSNKDYLQGIMNGTKKFLYSKDVSVIKLPQIKSLSIKEILVFAKEHTNIEDYLPKYKCNKLPNRDWLINVINSIGNLEFKKFIQKTLINREEQIMYSKRLNITAIPEIAKIFAASNNVSYSNGRTHFLMRAKQIGLKRKHHEMEVDTTEEVKETNNKLFTKIKELEKSLDEYKLREDLFLQDKEKLVKLYELEKIDSDGEYIEDE